MIVEFTLNGLEKRTTVRSGDRLVDILRKEPSAQSLLPDCLSGRCGRCFIFLDGRLAYACLVPAFKAKGSAILTYDSLAGTEEFVEIAAAMEQAEAHPCQFCRTAKIMAIADLLARSPLPQEKEILEQLDMAHCTCTDPEPLVRAVTLAIEFRNKRKFQRARK